MRLGSAPKPGRSRYGIFVVLSGLLVLSSCVYLRLLEIKKQLAHFDDNFAIGGRSELIIEFKNPVLRVKDARFLVGADPISSATVSGESVHHFEFELIQRSTDLALPPLGRLSLDLAFRDGKLVKIIVPETFMLLFPRNVLVDTLREAKDATVLEMKKLAQATIRLKPEVEAELPSLSKTLFLLGDPLEPAPDGALQVLTYRYRIVNGKRSPPILARLGFDAQGLLHMVYVKWDESSVQALFVREE